MEGVPGQETNVEPPILDEDLIAHKAAESLQRGPLGELVRQTFGAMQSAEGRIEELRGYNEVAAEKVAGLEERIEQADAQLQAAVGSVEERVISKGRNVQEAIAEQEQGAQDRLHKTASQLSVGFNEQAGLHIAKIQEVTDEARGHADRADIAAERVDTATRNTATMLTEARVVVNGLQSGSLEKIVEAIRYIRSNAENHPQQMALLKQAEGLAAPTHINQPLVDAAVRAGVPLWLHGEASSGKSTAGIVAAERLDLNFRSLGLNPYTSETKFAGFIDAGGTYRGTGFRNIYENGGIFLFDEIDNAHPGVLTLLNDGIANGHFEFPDARVPKHASTRFIAGANTIGKGATAEYVGRNRIDAATLDRFAFLQWDIDDTLEAALMLDTSRKEAAQQMDLTYREVDIAAGGVPTAKAWLKTVQNYRRVIAESGVKALVSTRAALYGRQLAEAGVGEANLREMLIYKGMNRTDREKIDRRV